MGRVRWGRRVVVERKWEEVGKTIRTVWEAPVEGAKGKEGQEAAEAALRGRFLGNFKEEVVGVGFPAFPIKVKDGKAMRVTTITQYIEGGKK
jgi:hypothetical protein